MQETVSGVSLLMYKQFLYSFCDQVSSLSFSKLFTRGSKYKALQYFHTQETKVDKTHYRFFGFIIYHPFISTIQYFTQQTIYKLHFNNILLLKGSLHSSYCTPQHSGAILFFRQIVCAERL